MAWKALTAIEVCDFLDFWRSQSWPMSAADARAIGARDLGWTLEFEDGDEFAMAYDHGLTIPDVTTSSVREGTSNVSMWVSDIIRDVTPGSMAFLGDSFTLMVREGTSRWGKPSLSRRRWQRASWNPDGGGEISISLTGKAIVADFYTPQGVESNRREGY